MPDDNDTLLGNGGINRIRRLFPDDEGVNVERDLWDSVAMEPARLSGTKIRFWSLRRAKNMHPLYREPSSKSDGEWSFNGPWEMMSHIEYDQNSDETPNASTDGKSTEIESKAWIARREFEDIGAPYPKEGDVIEFWDDAVWGKDKRHWDVVKATRDGNVFGSSVFVQFKIDMKTRSKFTPDRKLQDE